MQHFLLHDHEVSGPQEPLDPLGGRLLTADEVADYLRVDKATLRRWRRQLIGPPVILAAPATPRYPENGLILWKRDNAQLMGGRLAS